MENISHSLPNRSFTPSSNGGLTSHKSVYDDVFGGPPKSGIPTLAPRLEDYTEIFDGFHASRSSSIPVLNIPLIGDDSELHFDARSPGFSYDEVFGGFRGLEWMASFEDVVRQSSGEYYDSDEQWSPTQSGSLSDEINPLAGSDMSHRLSDGDADQLENNQQFMSYNKSSPRVVETMLAGTTHVTKFSAAPGYACSRYEIPVTWNGENNYCTMHVTNNINCSKDSRVTIPKENNYKCFSNPLGTDCYVNENKINLSEKQESDTSFSRPFMTVSDISLRTKPSRLPPPSRPPPALAVKKGENDRSFSKLKASKSYAFETEADDSGQLFFDVEVDVTLSAEGMKHRNKDVRLKWDTTKELTEKKNESWSHAKWNLEKVEKMSKKVGSHSSFKGEIPRESAYSVEEAMGSRKVTEEAPKSLGGPYSNHITDKFVGPVAWREEKEYFEVVEKNISSEPFDTVEDCSIFTQFKNPGVYRSLKISEAFDQKEDRKKPKVTILTPRWDGKMNQPKLARDDCVWGNKQRRKNTQIGLRNQKDFQEKVVILNKLSASTKRMEVDKRFIDAFQMKDNDGKHEKTIVREEYHRKIENVGRAEIRERLKERIEQEGFKRQQKGNESKLNESHVLNEMLKHADKYVVANEIKGGERHSVEVHKEKERLIDAGKQRLNELTFRTIFQRAGNDKVHEADLKWEVMNERNGDDSVREDNNLSFPKAESGNAGEICKPKENKDLSRDAGLPEFFGGAEEIELVERDWHETEANLDLESDDLIQGDQVEMLEGEPKLGEGMASKLAGEHNYPLIVEKPEAVSCDGNVGLKTQPYFSANESEAGVIDSLILKGKLNVCKEVQDGNTRIATNNAAESPSSPKQMADSNIGGTVRVFTCNMPDKTGSTEKIIPMEDDDDQKMKGTRVINEKVDIRDSSTPCQLIKESTVNGRKREDVSFVLEHNEDPLNQRIERNYKNMKENLVAKDQKVEDRIRREIELDSENLRKIEEEREREREREKDRMSVDKAALERSSVEARERAERATVEVRRRAIAVTRETLDNASVEARNRAERASVERATAEARQRAAEKLMAEKTVFERVEKPVSDRFSASSRSVDTKQSSFSYDIHFPHTGISSGIGHAYSSSGAEGESPQRCKARLDRYKRTAERAANALAEKNRRDLLVQIESEERNRVAEALDAEVKRWSKGKEGNLRALLSTLQYILGPDSGWQPIPLTEVITSTAVKRAYRKATLCVHPDKLQQRGASVQQKYTCEKVFDLLKEAWNNFNSEE